MNITAIYPGATTNASTSSNMNVPAIVVLSPTIASAPALPISTMVFSMIGMFIPSTLFARTPITNPIIAAAISATIGPAIPPTARPNNDATTPIPSAIIPMDGTPVPRP